MIPKFRAWDRTRNKMIDVDEIHFYNGKLDFIGDAITFMRTVDEIELMQSTGLKDRNGKEIFEGDVVQFEDCYTESDFLYINKGIVEWSQGSFTVTNRDSVEMEDLLDGEILDVIIIGNIHENPELLEVGD